MFVENNVLIGIIAVADTIKKEAISAIKTLKKMGWVAELQEGSSVIHVPYDLEGLQAGALFEVPSGIDTAKPRLFRVISMQNIMVYPASIACEIAPEYRDTDEKTLVEDFTKTNFNMLIDNEEDD